MVFGLNHDPVANSIVFLEESLYIQLEDRVYKCINVERRTSIIVSLTSQAARMKGLLVILDDI